MDWQFYESIHRGVDAKRLNELKRVGNVTAVIWFGPGPFVGPP